MAVAADCHGSWFCFMRQGCQRDCRRQSNQANNSSREVGVHLADRSYTSGTVSVGVAQLVWMLTVLSGRPEDKTIYPGALLVRFSRLLEKNLHPQIDWHGNRMNVVTADR
ncbi:hypothetical protein FHS27_005034 [Rhodopirellula rubra]|uniref:Uncharacterized protein n=1 Tax=Aporhodopirellula rubra TaxID=980271 RepID=A0A7W5H8N6_9BACT|nr:hypothetical protein [Aporhodopirellula rubra]